MYRLITLMITLSIITSLHAQDEFPAPFGLSWDTTTTEIKDLGFTKSQGDEIIAWTGVNVPKAWSKGKTYILLTYQDKLVKASVLSESISGDITGSEGKELYEEMKALLTKKYGEPKDSMEAVGRSVYKDYDEFYQCLDYDGCGIYISAFYVAGGYISIQLIGTSRGYGYLQVSYEPPAFGEAKRAIEQAKAETDDDAF